jgi:hypothetical protein
MIDHLSTYATDFLPTKDFYKAALQALGYAVQSELTFESDPDLPGRRACAFGPDGRYALVFVLLVRERRTAENPSAA